MSARAAQAWLTLLERLPANRLVIFTTTEELSENLYGGFGKPLANRCKVIKFTNQGLAQPAAAHVQRIAQAEGLDGQPIARYVRLLQDCKNSIREALQRVESGELVEAVLQ